MDKGRYFPHFLCSYLFEFFARMILTFLQTASVLFVDAPVGTGFSYATSAEEYPSSDLKTAAQVTGFLRKVIDLGHENSTN